MTREIEAAERERQVLELRAAGYTFAEIAQMMGYADKSGAYKAFQRAMERHNDYVAILADYNRDLILMYIDEILKGLFPRVKSGHPRAAEVALLALDRKIKLLGLDQPKSDLGEALAAIIERLRSGYVAAGAELERPSD